MNYKASADFGNSSFKIIVNDDVMQKIPNVVTYRKPNYDVDMHLLESKQKKMGRDRLDVEVTLKRNTIDKEVYNFVIGELADKLPEKENREAAEKSSDNQLVAQAVTSIAYSVLLQKLKNKENITKDMTIRVDLSTGLPYKEWKNVENRRKFIERLKGSHLVKFNHNYFIKKLGVSSIEVIFDETYCFSEGICTLNYILNDEKNDLSEIEEYKLLNKCVGIVDLGALTTEIITFEFNSAEDLEEYEREEDIEVMADVLSNSSDGLDSGVGHIMMSTIDTIERNHNIDGLVRRDIETALTLVPKGMLKGYGIDISDYFEEIAKPFAIKVAKKIIGLYKRTNLKDRILRIYLTGGGSKVSPIVDTIKAELMRDGYDAEKIVCLTEPDPVFCNAIGYYKELEYMEEELAEEE